MPHVKPRLGPGWAVTFVALGLVVPLLAVMGLRFQMVKETRTKAEAYEAFKLATTELHSQIAQESDLSETNMLRERLANLESERIRAQHALDGAVSAKGVSLIALLVIDLPFVGIGTWREWTHLKDLRSGRLNQGGGRAMFAALFLPLIVLFGAVFALIYVPASNATGAARSIGTSLAFVGAFGACFWLARSTWRWAYRIEAPPRAGHFRSASTTIKLLAILLILAIIAVPVMLVVYWSMAAAPSSSFTTPASASVGNNTNSTYCVYEGTDIHFILHYAGDFSTSTSSSSNAVNRAWNNDGTIILPNDRTVAFFRHSGDPSTLRLNGKVYYLDEGRVFSIHSPSDIRQLDFPTEVVNDQQDLERFSSDLVQSQLLP